MWIKLILFFAFFSVVVGQEVAQPCPDDPTECERPNCFCSTTDSTKILEPISDIPQLVLLTFDDAVNPINFEYYQTLFERTNPNGAKIGATFFVTHDFNDYSLTHQLFRNHFEIALHSITHQTDSDYWKNLDEDGWRAEVIDQIQQMSHFAKIPAPLIKGFRAPFLQTGGNTMYKVLSESLLWESSMPTLAHRRPGLWPYSNDYASIQDCQIQPCRDQSFPGFWTHPMLGGENKFGNFSCSMLDACVPIPETAEDMYEFLKLNFDAHYLPDEENDPPIRNRAPFPIMIHYAWIVNPDVRQGFDQFLDYLATLEDVYLTTMSQAISFVQAPVAVGDITETSPTYLAKKNTLPDGCAVKHSCHFIDVPQGGERYMTLCQPCPDNYPWLGNPIGE